jgi:hypothetical protein
MVKKRYERMVREGSRCRRIVPLMGISTSWGSHIPRKNFVQLVDLAHRNPANVGDWALKGRSQRPAEPKSTVDGRGRRTSARTRVGHHT